MDKTASETFDVEEQATAKEAPTRGVESTAASRELKRTRNYHDVSRAYMKEKLLCESENAWRAEVLHSLRAQERVVEMVHQAGLIICAVIVGGAIVWLQFIMVPLTLAYFITYLLAPLLDLLEARPMQCGKRSLCASDPSPRGGIVGFLQNLIMRGELPHGLSLLITLGTSVLLVYSMLSLMKDSLSEFLKDGDKIKAKFYEMEHEGFQSLREMGLNVAENSTFLPEESEPVSIDDLKELFTGLALVMNEVILVLLLSIYLLLDRLPGATVRGDQAAIIEIESMIKHYITLKTYISALTGVVCGSILFGLGVKLASLWGMLSFVLNYIPNVGSIIAILLPLPIAFLDDDISSNNKILAFLLPGLVQGYVGNFLEPQIFGKSLNMTPMSVLLSLVFWGLVWGLPGAVLSVPFLGIMKILLSHSDHVFAVGLVSCIRQFPDVDEEQERDGAFSNLLTAADPRTQLKMLVAGDSIEEEDSILGAAELSKEVLESVLENPVAQAGLADDDGGRTPRKAEALAADDDAIDEDVES